MEGGFSTLFHPLRSQLDPNKSMKDLLTKSAVFVVFTGATHAASMFGNVTIEPPGLTNVSVTGGSMAVGYNNIASLKSLASGLANDVAYYSVGFGQQNIVGGSSFATGYSNDVNINSVGYANAQQYGRYSAAFGSNHTVTGFNSVSAGNSNRIEANNSIALGRGLESFTDDTVVLGTYNIDSPEYVFAFGNGDSDSQRSNALEVKASGEATFRNRYWDYSNPQNVPTEVEAHEGRALVVEGHSRFRGNMEIFGDIQTPGTFAGGSGVASGAYSFVGNGGSATNTQSVAFSSGSAIGEAAFAVGRQGFGQPARANGDRSVALFGTAVGDDSMAFAQGVTYGDNSIAIGESNIAVGLNTTVLGRFADPGNPEGTDPYSWALNQSRDIPHPGGHLFVVGSGQSHEQRSNAMVINHDGDTSLNGNVDVAGSLAVGGSTVVTHSSLEDLSRVRSFGTGIVLGGEDADTVVSGDNTLAWGDGARALEHAATAWGIDTEANGDNTTAFGLGTIAMEDNSTALGKYNDPTAGAIFTVGNGTASDPHNAFQVGIDGSSHFGGDLSLDASSTLYANKIENTGTSQLVIKASDDVRVEASTFSVGGESTASALTVHQDGAVTMSSAKVTGILEVEGIVVTAEPTGDLSMGRFTASSN